MRMNCTLEELLAVDMSHTFRDGELGFTGLATGKAAATYITNIPLAAMELAKRTHAPNLDIWLCGVYANADWSSLDGMPESEFEQEMMYLSCEAQEYDYPVTPYAARGGEVSFGFGSGVQVDREGNINSVCVGDSRHPKVALVGSIFLTEHMALFGREYIMMPHHERRNFVEKVDYISGVGFPGGREGRAKLGLRGGGPAYIYTPRCIFAFDEEGKIYVRSIHPGVTRQEVMDNTGFELGDLDSVPTTPLPTEEELRILREEVDPRGILLRPAE